MLGDVPFSWEAVRIGLGNDPRSWWWSSHFVPGVPLGASRVITAGAGVIFAYNVRKWGPPRRDVFKVTPKLAEPG